MDVKIQINGTFLDGLTKTEVKLSINASSPYSFGESTRTYSANIKAPRNQVNDGIFYQMRNFGYVMRDTKYEAKIYLGGIAINKRFKAKVTCDEESYSIALSQSDLKMSQLPKEVVEATLIDSKVGNTRFFRASDLIKQALGTVNPVTFPDIDYGGYAPGLIIENKGQVGITALLVGKSVTVFWRYASETDDGTKYFRGNALDIKEYDTRTAMTAPGGVTESTVAVVTMDNDNAYITLDMSKVGTVLSYVVLKAVYNNQTVAIFQKDGEQNDITQVRYKYVFTTMTIPICNFYGFYVSRDINDHNRLNALPPSFMSPDEAVNLSGKITSLQNTAGLTQEFGNCGVSDAITYLTDICKIFQWGWKFTLTEDVNGNTDVNVNVYKLIADEARNVAQNGPITFNDFRQDWSDFYLSTDKIEDSEGFPNTAVFKIGDYFKSLQVSKASFTAKGDIVESNVPYPQDGTYPRFAIRKGEVGSGSTWVEYFKSINYTQSLQKYYGLFSDALDVTIKAKIPYYYIENKYKENGVVWFKQLNAFFYIRSITDYNLSTQECKIKLTKINLLRQK